nr:PREDICTED: COMM domain-containing protein 1 isoform X1 [Struthio camelus australis]
MREHQKSIASADMDLNQLEAFLTAQTKKQGGITSDQAAVIAKFWKNHRIKIRESLINQSRWDNVLKNMNWRVDLKSQSRHIDQINTPVAIVEMELGRNGQVTRKSSEAFADLQAGSESAQPLVPGVRASTPGDIHVTFPASTARGER